MKSGMVALSLLAIAACGGGDKKGASEPNAPAPSSQSSTSGDVATPTGKVVVVELYSDAQGNASDAANPNGSVRHIAGIMNVAGNVLGLMPHPERASEGILGSAEGLGIFESVLAGEKSAAR